MKDISTLVADIYSVIDTNGFKVNPELTAEFGVKLAQRISNRVEEERGQGKLRLSTMSHPCTRKVWYEINEPQSAEPFSPETKFKFLYGDILEETVLFLAKLAGHKVEGEQDEIDLYGVKGHRDSIIDGLTVDVKSASSFSYNHFASGLTPKHDGFGYLGQLDSYVEGSRLDDRVLYKDSGAFLAIDKQLGKITLDVHPRADINWRSRVFELQKICADGTPPPRAFSSIPDGASGNQKLDTICSYCAFKNRCWPGLRTFLYSRGPVFLVKTVRVPDVPEV